MTSGIAIDTAATLARARRARGEADAAEVEVLLAAQEWALQHEVTEAGSIATWRDSPIPLAGEGAPLISEFCVSEFATALHMSQDSGRLFMSEALELASRLPRTQEQVRAGRLQVWKARRIAAGTLGLNVEAAAYVDHQVARFAARISGAALQRLVDEAIARFMPETAARLARDAADTRFVDIDHQQVSFIGTSRIQGELDLADALDLDAALQTGAAQLAEVAPELPLGVRRALALGALSRGQFALAFEESETSASPTNGRRPRPSRQIVLHVHLSESAVQRRGVGYVEEGKHLVTADQIREWCGRPETQVVVRPVIDLHDEQSAMGYAAPDRTREHVIQRDRTCVFPFCERNARSCDLDHIEPYDPDGPPDQTSTLNLAPLCRRHHRLKTHGRWHYSMIEPGTYLWRSPYGYRYLRDSSGTRDLTPRPVDPPGD